MVQLGYELYPKWNALFRQIGPRYGSLIQDLSLRYTYQLPSPNGRCTRLLEQLSCAKVNPKYLKVRFVPHLLMVSRPTKEFAVFFISLTYCLETVQRLQLGGSSLNATAPSRYYVFQRLAAGS